MTEERRLVTVLFADVMGSMRALETLGDVDYLSRVGQRIRRHA